MSEAPTPTQGSQVKPPRVFVVDDHPLVRSGVRRELEGRVDVVGTAGDVDEAVTGIAAAQPDVVLVDVHMPGGGGAELIKRVLGSVAAAGKDDSETAASAPRFLALSVSDAAEDVIAVIRAGARGYLTKTVSGAELAEAIGRVGAGDAVFSPRLAGFVLDAFAGSMPLPSDPELDQLTAREREVLRLIARGYAYKEVARRLNLSVKTVETHVSSVLRKLQLSSRHELTRWATERRLV
jgi:DNA-binding NarL/FixJ family response regulator